MSEPPGYEGGGGMGNWVTPETQMCAHQPRPCLAGPVWQPSGRRYLRPVTHVDTRSPRGSLLTAARPTRARPRPPVITPFLLQERVHRHRVSGLLPAATTSLSKQLLHNRLHTPPIESSNRGLLLTCSPPTHSLSQGPSKHQAISSAIIKGKRGKEAVPRPPAPSSRTERLGHRSQTHRKQAAACGSQKPQ